jgi:hypothetical protein
MRHSLLIRAAKRASTLNVVSRTSLLSRGIGAVCLGLFVLALSWIVWETTGSFLGWLALYVPGGLYVLAGCCWVIADE